MSRPVRSLRSGTVVAVVLALVACKKDGSGSGLTLSPTSVAFSADQNGAIPPPQSIQITVTDSSAAFVVAGYPQGASVPSWMALSISGAGSLWSLQSTITSTGLAPGTYSATLRVAITRSDETVIAYHDAQVTYTVAGGLSAAPPALAFTHVTGSAAPAAKTVSVAGTGGLSWTASSNQSWVVLGSTSGTTPSTVVVGVDPTGLGVGPYTAKVTFSAAGKTAIVDVSLSVNAVALQTSASALSYGGVNGAPIAAQSLDVSMNNAAAVNWSATAGAGWVVLSKTSGTTPDTLSVSVDPSIGPLASGTYGSTVTVTSAGGSLLTATVNVDLTLTMAAFSLSPNALVLGGASGRDLSSKSVQLGLNTGTNAHAWTATPSNTWMAASSTASTTSSTAVTVNVTPDRTGLQGGTRTGSVGFSAMVNGDTISTSLPVTFNLEAHKLLVADNGVALASMPALSTLTKTVRVTDNLGAPTPWMASSDQTWLSVTASGTAGGDLVLTANPTSAGANSLNLATVTITSSDTTVENAEIVRVGLWVGSATPAAVTVNGTFAEAVADPIRPYAYVHAGGGSISVYNVHTGASVTSIPGLPTSLGAMAVANDGTGLYVVDKTAAKVVPVNLNNLTIGNAWNLASGASSSPRVSYMRTNGLPVLVIADGVIHGAVDGAVLATFAQSSQLSSSTLVTTSLQGNAFCAGGCRSLDYSAVGGGTLSMASLMGGFASRDIALNADGSGVYGASGAPYHCTRDDTATGAVGQLGPDRPYPGNVEVGPDGRIYCGRYSTISSDKDVYVFDSAGTELGSVRLAGTSGIGLLDRQLLISGDGLRVIGLDPALKIVTAP